MTFDEYNTDEVFNGDSTADELVRLAKEEKKERADVENSLSPLWKEDKKGNVKKALDKYYPSETPKEEPKKEEAPKVEEMTQTTEALKPESETKIKDSDKKFLEDTNAIATEQENAELNKVIDYRSKDWDNTVDNMKRQGDAFKKIDDKLIEQLPTFMFKRYQQGEFGDPKSSDAKLRLAYFAMNNVVSKLKQFANASAAARGQGTLFQNTESAYDQYQANNLQRGMENRWKKYEAETDAAIKLATERGMKEEEAYDSVKTISRNQRLQTAFNMMNEKQKVYLMNVTKEIGDKIGSFDNKELIDFLTGAAVSGDKLTWQEAAAIAVARFGPDVMKAAKEGKGKISGDEKIAGFGGKGKSSATLEDGTKIAPGVNMSKDELAQLRAEAEKLGNKFYNGEMTEEEFRKEYAKLEGVMNEHGIRKLVDGGIMSQDDYLKQIRRNKRVDLSSQIDALNAKAKNGDIKPSEYDEKFKALKAQAAEWGASEKDLQSIEKGKVKDDKILKASEKKSKKK